MAITAPFIRTGRMTGCRQQATRQGAENKKRPTGKSDAFASRETVHETRPVLQDGISALIKSMMPSRWQDYVLPFFRCAEAAPINETATIAAPAKTFIDVPHVFFDLSDKHSPSAVAMATASSRR